MQPNSGLFFTSEWADAASLADAASREVLFQSARVTKAPTQSYTVWVGQTDQFHTREAKPNDAKRRRSRRLDLDRNDAKEVHVLSRSTERNPL